MHKHRPNQSIIRPRLVLGAALLLLSLSLVAPALGEGSGTLYRGSQPSRYRGNLEWRTGSYGGGDSPDFVLRRRTLLRVFALQGETILLGSSGIGVGGSLDNGDIRIFNPGQVGGTIGQETIPALAGNATPLQPGGFANGFSCVAQRNTAGNQARGRISSRFQELAGPQPTPNGYTPCVYTAPANGIYSVVFSGPSGEANTEPRVSGRLQATTQDFGPSQNTSVAAWDVTVRDASNTEQRGRLFTSYYTANTGGGGRPITGTGYVVTSKGFRYRILFDGDPHGFVFYANQSGFQNSDGTPLYHNLMADPTKDVQTQNELRELQGSVRLLPPQYPIFLSEPDPLVLDALGIPSQPVAPAISDFAFRGPNGDTTTTQKQGGVFNFTTTQPGNYAVVISRDGTTFDPTAERNRVLRGVTNVGGTVSITWDGRDNAGEPFPEGDYLAATAVQGGEVHFPFLDVENNVRGGPVIELINPPDVNGDSVGDCPPWNGGCFGAFYDDRSYRTADGTLIGTAVGGPLCPGDANNPRGFGRPPLVAASDTVRGFDTRTAQRGFGFPGPANPASVCLPNGGFGDKKGLDLWTYYPSNVLQTPLRIVGPTAVVLQSFTAIRTNEQTLVRWQTASEANTLGFYLLRSTTGNPADAVRVTPNLIPARGNATSGAAYSWVDTLNSSGDNGNYYWLQEIEADGTARVYGPVRASAATSEAPYQLLIPLTAR